MTQLAHRQTVLPPREEDRALFSDPLGQREVALIPDYHTNGYGERVIHGFLPGNVPVEVVFSGRRQNLAVPLVDRLDKLLARHRARRDGPVALDSVRMRVAVYGSWRSRFTQDHDGWQTKRLQLIAAIWRVRESSGRYVTRGSAPMLNRRSHLRPL